MQFNSKIFEEDAGKMEEILSLLTGEGEDRAYFVFFWLAKSIYDIITYFILKEIKK